MMLDAFAVGSGGGFADAQGQQKCLNDFVAFTAFAGERPAVTGQVKRLVWFGRDVTVPNKSRYGVVDRCMRHVEQLHQVV